MFEFLKRGRQPEKETVTFDAEEVVRTMRNGRQERVRWDDLVEVGIVTTDEGPWLDDFYWLLLGTNGGCAVPSEADGSQELLARLQSLPGFDNEAVVRASCCTENANFVAWRRTETAPNSVEASEG